jgi:hypothetical protein
MGGHLEIFRVLLKNGANINAQGGGGRTVRSWFSRDWVSELDV